MSLGNWQRHEDVLVGLGTGLGNRPRKCGGHEDVRAMAQSTKGIACDLIDGKGAWAENSDESSDLLRVRACLNSSDGEFESSSEDDE